jgi:hypothetical protein
MNIIIDDGYNTSYIDSLLIALFYSKRNNILYNMLSDIPEQIHFSYLQDLIQTNFIEQIKNGFTIDITIINEIRNYSIMCGWKDSPNMTDLFNIVDYMCFLTTGFGTNMKYELMDKTNHTVETKNIDYINIKLTIDDDMRVDELLQNWTNENFVQQNKLYQFKEIPIMIPIYLDRLMYDRWNSNKVDIMKRIMFNSQKECSWIIHSIICVSNKKYYSIVNYDNEWFMFSNNKIPAFIKINIKNEDIANKIRQECILIIYKLDS